MSRFHIPALQATPGVELVALADPYAPALEERGGQFGIPPASRYADYSEMLARERLDVVTICTQAPVHCAATLAAAEAGVRGIFCEKPIALDLVEADRMVAACEVHGAVLAINHWLRLAPATQKAVELVRDGVIGEPLAIRIHDKGGRPAGIALIELCTHFFDLARLFGGDPAWVQAQFSVLDDGVARLAGPGDVKPSQVAWPRDKDCGLIMGDRCSATFGFLPNLEMNSRGLVTTYQGFFQPPGKTWRSGIEILGLDGVLALNSSGEGALELHLHRGPWETPGRFEPILVGDAALPRFQDGRPAGPDEFFVPGMVGMLESLVRALDAGEEHPSSGRDGRWAMEMIMGAFASHAQGRLLTLPLAERRHPLERWVAAQAVTA
jgi:predicted dehydrogenase